MYGRRMGGAGREAYGHSYANLRDVARKQVLVQLDDRQVAELDHRAREARVSRSELIRRAVDAHLRDLDWERLDQQTIAGYARVPERPEGLERWHED